MPYSTETQEDTQEGDDERLLELLEQHREPPEPRTEEQELRSMYPRGS